MVAFATTSSPSAELFGLMTVCPYTQSNPEDCALHELRKLPLAELYAMVRCASEEDLAEFASVCTSCPHRCIHSRRW